MSTTNLEFERKVQLDRKRMLLASAWSMNRELGARLCSHPRDRCGHPSCIWCRYDVQSRVKDRVWQAFKDLPGARLGWLTINLEELPRFVSVRELKRKAEEHTKKLRNIFDRKLPRDVVLWGGKEIEWHEERGYWNQPFQGGVSPLE